MRKGAVFLQPLFVICGKSAFGLHNGSNRVHKIGNLVNCLLHCFFCAFVFSHRRARRRHNRADSHGNAESFHNIYRFLFHNNSSEKYLRGVPRSYIVCIKRRNKVYKNMLFSKIFRKKHLLKELFVKKQKIFRFFVGIFWNFCSIRFFVV